MNYPELLRTGRGLIIACAVATAALILNIYLSWQFHSSIAAAKAILPIPFYVIFGIGALVASIYASALGGLSCENDGHLPLAWTKPASRTGFALEKFAIHLGAILFLFAFMSAVAYGIFVTYGLARHFFFSPDWIAQTFRLILEPIAFYAVAQALTASTSKQAGMVRGTMWGAIFAIILLGSMQLPGPIALIVNALGYLVPCTYVGIETGNTASLLSIPAETLRLALVSSVGFVGAIVQWRRLEA